MKISNNRRTDGVRIITEIDIWKTDLVVLQHFIPQEIEMVPIGG
jgi:hypothetical protein